MGRLPNTYADRTIYGRDPYAMYGELSFTSAEGNKQFPSATFQCTVDRPFEVHRMIPRVVALDDEGVPLPTQPSQDLLAALIRVTIQALDRVQMLTKVPTRIGNLTKGEAERTWEWADPEYLDKSTGFEVTAETTGTFPTIDGLVSLLVCISFEGFLLIIHPPTNNR
jgi:hypothetical protein